MTEEFCLGCNRATALRDCGCPAGTAWRSVVRPLFIPLKAEYYRDFECGLKTTEYRRYGPRWNERTCKPGRSVVLSLGYAKRERLRGTVAAFVAEPLACLENHVVRELGALFPGLDWHAKIACISIELGERPSMRERER